MGLSERSTLEFVRDFQSPHHLVVVSVVAPFNESNRGPLSDLLIYLSYGRSDSMCDSASMIVSISCASHTSSLTPADLAV